MSAMGVNKDMTSQMTGEAAHNRDIERLKMVINLARCTSYSN
jgi:hypothetical protein